MLELIRRLLLNDRAKNPFISTLIISWLAWNWKPVYITLFVDNDNLPVGVTNKMTYVTRFIEWDRSLWIPLGVAVGAIIVIQSLSLGAYIIALYFKSWELRFKNDILDKDRLLTKEEMDIEKEIRHRREKTHQDELQIKDREIKYQETVNESLHKIISDKDQEFRKYKVLYAEYGSVEHMVDVTEAFKGWINKHYPEFNERTNFQFQVSNEKLVGDSDPARGIVKDFLAIFQLDGNIQPIKIREREMLFIEHGKITVATYDYNVRVVDPKQLTLEEYRIRREEIRKNSQPSVPRKFKGLSK